jgi:hypothetical protein
VKNYRYSLDRSSKKYICSECERKTFVLYIDNHTGKPLHSTVGKCDRADNCGHHYTPKQYFTDNRISVDRKKEYVPRPKPTPKPQPSFIDTDIFIKSLSSYQRNNLALWLTGVVGEKQASEAFRRYFVGTSERWSGATVFWQIDTQGRVRAGKIMQYDTATGKRVKQPENRITWVHKALKLPNYSLQQCFFGEHLLRDKSKRVAIVESEKTAVVASIYLPNMIWLACGGSEGLNSDKCSVLKGRKVILFPDCGQYDKWSAKAKELSKVCAVSVSSLIEQRATEQERQAGFDIADYLVQLALQQFTQ